MNVLESLFFWFSALLQASAFFIVLLSLIFKKTKTFGAGKIFYFLSFLALTVFGIIRWVETGHPPFVTLFESMITAIWFMMLLYHLFRLKFDRISVLILPLSFISFLMMGWASSLSADASPLSAALSNIWLFIHASFATLGAAAFLIAASLAVLYLIGEEKLNSMEFAAKQVPIYKNPCPSSALPYAILTISSYFCFSMVLMVWVVFSLTRSPTLFSDI